MARPEILELSGGRKGIFTDGKTITRPLCVWTENVHRYLEYIAPKMQFNIPKPVSIDHDSVIEVLTYVVGESHNYPLPDAFFTDEMIISAAQCLRNLHDSSKGYLDAIPQGSFEWMLPPLEPMEIICHGDFAPYNVSIEGAKVTGVFDFDTIHPGPAIRDVAYAVYRFVPLMSSDAETETLVPEVLIQRLNLFVQSYGREFQLLEVFDAMVERLNDLIKFIRSEAKKGSEKFIQDIADGHIASYLRDIELIKKTKSEYELR